MNRLVIGLLAGAIACLPLSALAEDKPAAPTQTLDKKDATGTQAPDKKMETDKDQKKPKRKKVGGCG